MNAHKVQELMTSELDSFVREEDVIQMILSKNLDLDQVAILVLQHDKNGQIVEIQEVFSYGPLQFIGDAGGSIGVFLGISFWSVYLDFVEPFVSRIKSYIFK